MSQLSVKAGSSIVIPCLYRQDYIQNVKYWCRGSAWNHCSVEAQTSSSTLGKVSVSDYAHQRVFTVTMRDIQPNNYGYYWCAVDLRGQYDDGVYLYLYVTTGNPELYVDRQNVTGVEEGTIHFQCHYNVDGPLKWCRLGGSCVEGDSGTLDGSSVFINHTKRGIFTVTMSGLKTESAGWYWCAKGDYQMPVYVTVNQETTIQTQTTFAKSISSKHTTVNLTKVPFSQRQWWEPTIFYPAKACNVMLLLICTILAVGIYRDQRNYKAEVRRSCVTATFQMT